MNAKETSGAKWLTGKLPAAPGPVVTKRHPAELPYPRELSRWMRVAEGKGVAIDANGYPHGPGFWIGVYSEAKRRRGEYIVACEDLCLAQ